MASQHPIQRQMCLYGGINGIRDSGLLESAVYAAQHTYLYSPKATKNMLATCYAYHIHKIQAFLDGNKRTAVACALAFLKLNGATINVPEHVVLKLTEQIATGETSKAAFAAYLAATKV